MGDRKFRGVGDVGQRNDRRAQVTTSYGEDPVPGSNEIFERWAGYGTDPVPPTTFQDERGALWAYGLDPVPNTPQSRPGDILPGESLQVLTGDYQPARGRSRRGR